MDGRKQQVIIRCCMGLITGLLFSTQSPDLKACPFCSGPSRTLSEQLSQSDTTVLARWSEAEKGSLKKEGKTTFEIKTMIRQPENGVLKVGDQISIPQHRIGKKETLFLLFDTKSGPGIRWDTPIEITELCYHYISQAPPSKEITTKRLRYFLKFLEHPDQKIANDAFAEFANASYKNIDALSHEMPRGKIREWLVSSDTPVVRLGLYGLLLGLCGQESDIAFMEQKINEPTQKIRLGIDGLIAGYLLLSGADGLKNIEQTKFLSQTVPYSETLAAIKALRFMWTYGDGRISKERLRESMRLLLGRPELTDLVIADLARWNDWSILDRLMKMYGAEEYDVPSIKRSIVRYLRVAAKGKNKKGHGADAVTATKAKQLLDQLRKDDPKTVQSAERFFR